MPENNTTSQDADSTAQSDTQTRPYPARDADNGEEQRNRLGYMATEPTEDEIEGDEDKSNADTPTNPTAPSAA